MRASAQCVPASLSTIFRTLDFGRRDSVFVPFFGGRGDNHRTFPPRTRRKAAVVPHHAMLPGGQGYVVDVGEAWETSRRTTFQLIPRA